MPAEPEVNADPKEVVIIETGKMSCEPAGYPGVFRKVLERIADARKGRETLLLNLERNRRTNPAAKSERLAGPRQSRS